MLRYRNLAKISPSRRTWFTSRLPATRLTLLSLIAITLLTLLLAVRK